MEPQATINWSEIVIACIPLIITAIVTYIMLRIQMNKTAEIAANDRKASMNYTKYQCEWQRIQNIKEKGSKVILTHDLQIFNIWAESIQNKLPDKEKM